MAQGDEGDKQGEKEGNLLGLPETETELDVSLLNWNTILAPFSALDA